MGSRLVRCQSPGLLRQGIPCTQSFPRQHAASARLVPRRRHPRPPSWTCWPPASKKLATRRASGCIRCSRASSTSTWPARCSRDRSDAGATKRWMHCCRFSRPHCRPGCPATVHREQTVGNPGRVEGQGTTAKDRRALAPARLLGRLPTATLRARALSTAWNISRHETRACDPCRMRCPRDIHRLICNPLGASASTMPDPRLKQIPPYGAGKG